MGGNLYSNKDNNFNGLPSKIQSDKLCISTFEQTHFQNYSKIAMTISNSSIVPGITPVSLP